jgi:hypothetical protein
LESLLEAARPRAVGPILPKLSTEDERLAIVLPWDPSYPSLEGDGLETSIVMKITRIVQTDRGWEARSGAAS